MGEGATVIIINKFTEEDLNVHYSTKFNYNIFRSMMYNGAPPIDYLRKYTDCNILTNHSNDCNSNDCNSTDCNSTDCNSAKYSGDSTKCILNSSKTKNNTMYHNLFNLYKSKLIGRLNSLLPTNQFNIA